MSEKTLSRDDPNAGIATMRETLRQQKGEEAVAELDAAMASQQKLERDIRAIIDEHLKANVGGEGYALTAVVEGLSQLFAEHCVPLAKVREIKGAALVSLAITSITSNLQIALEKETLAAAPTDWLANLKNGGEE